MDVAFLIKEYFKGVESNLSIDVFDSFTLNSVYSNVLNTLTSHFEIETSVLLSLRYCFYEILDNVHIHSGHHKLIDKNGDISIVSNGFWQGTIVYMEISTNIDVNPNDVVENRTDIEAEFNEPFLESDELNTLW